MISALLCVGVINLSVVECVDAGNFNDVIVFDGRRVFAIQPDRITCWSTGDAKKTWAAPHPPVVPLHGFLDRPNQQIVLAAAEPALKGRRLVLLRFETEQGRLISRNEVANAKVDTASELSLVRVTPHGMVALSAPSTYSVWDINTCQRRASLDIGVNSIAMAPAGGFLAATSAEESLCVIDVKEWSVNMLLRFRGRPLALCDDLSYLVAQSQDGVFAVRLQDEHHQKIAPFLDAAAVDPDSTRLLGVRSGQLEVWDLPIAKKLDDMRLPSRCSRWVVEIRDGRFAVAGSVLHPHQSPANGTLFVGHIVGAQ